MKYVLYAIFGIVVGTVAALTVNAYTVTADQMTVQDRAK